MKYYFINEEDPECWTKAGIQDYMKENDMTELTVFEAKIQKVPGMFYCKLFKEATEIEPDTCGLSCDSYEPRNGKSGCCRFRGDFHENGDKLKKFRIKKSDK